METRDVVVKITNEKYDDKIITAVSDPVLTDLLDIGGAQPKSALLITTQGITNAVGGILKQFYIYREGDHVTVEKEVTLAEHWTG